MRTRVFGVACIVAITGCSVIVSTSGLGGGPETTGENVVAQDGGADGADAAPCTGDQCSCDDADNDGFRRCDPDPAKVDCDDHDAKVFPGAKEVCDGNDNDCSGVVDDVPAVLHGSLVDPVDSHWVPVGTATFVDAGAQLTGDVAVQAGAIWWGAPYTFDTFDMKATFIIQDKSDGADGMGFGWIPGMDLGVVGSGGAFGVGGLGGYTVSIDTYYNADEPAVPYVAASSDDVRIATATVAKVRDGKPHTIHVAFDMGVISVWIDEILYIDHAKFEGYTPFKGHWGWGAGTGGSYEAHYVTDVTMTFPKGQGCPQ